MESDSPYINGTNKLVAASSLDFLLIEIVPLAQSIVQQLIEDAGARPGRPGSSSSANGGGAGGAGGSNVSGGISGTSSSPANSSMTADENLDDVYYRIEGYGHRVGLGLSQIFTKDRPWFTDQLDIMKFVCKELWVILYKKQIDNLKTNHRGTYVLTDTQFKYCSRMGTAYGPKETLRRATPYLWFPAGVIRGALSALGIDAAVTFDADQLPKVTFNIQTSPT
ncbi:Trs33p [Sugiyamaella lignohabitans]|uniref:Trs33p n=1 Tax=Sugiyamaella lignohabitans TaxID=796027 RepID=A0A167EDD5_9ASCO|nr:Trs33p [Sugiyamaella lignohabitans]ANB13931.1 Trs33p [Sugiyamaella lignohabitans]